MDALPEPIRVFSSFAKSARIHSSLTAILKKIVEEESKKQPTPKGYLIVTDLVNPVPKIQAILNPSIPVPPDVTRRLKNGDRLHSFAAQWFREIEGYTEEESILDGAFVGIPGVRGRLDAFIKQAIIEFKTKDQKINENIPETVEQIVNNYPHDLEQLVFYATIHPSHPKNNYLVFMEAHEKQQIKAFRVAIKDFEATKQILNERIKLVKAAIENKDDKTLGQCRYCRKHCYFQDAKSCGCNSLKPFDISRLLKQLEIAEDDAFKQEIEKARKNTRDNQIVIIRPSTILYPRNYFADVKGEEKAPFTPDEHYSCLWHCVRKMGFLTDEADLRLLKNCNEKVKCKHNWKKIPISGKTEPILVPFINKVSAASKIPSSPSPYALAELAILCALYNKQRGLVMVMYPNLGKLVHVYEVTFENLVDIRKEIETRLKQLEDAIKNNDPSVLPELPSFMEDRTTTMTVTEDESKQTK